MYLYEGRDKATIVFWEQPKTHLLRICVTCSTCYQWKQDTKWSKSTPCWSLMPQNDLTPFAICHAVLLFVHVLSFYSGDVPNTFPFRFCDVSSFVSHLASLPDEGVSDSFNLMFSILFFVTFFFFFFFRFVLSCFFPPVFCVCSQLCLFEGWLLFCLFLFCLLVCLFLLLHHCLCQILLSASLYHRL